MKLNEPVNDAQMVFSFSSPTVMSQGDGSYVVRPGRLLSEFTPKQFARVFNISRSTVYRLKDEGHISFRRPSPRKIMIPAAEVESFRRKTDDPEFWDRVRSSKK